MHLRQAIVDAISSQGGRQGFLRPGRIFGGVVHEQASIRAAGKREGKPGVALDGGIEQGEGALQAFLIALDAQQIAAAEIGVVGIAAIGGPGAGARQLLLGLVDMQTGHQHIESVIFQGDETLA